jgi:hypothetical protein
MRQALRPANSRLLAKAGGCLGKAFLDQAFGVVDPTSQQGIMAQSVRFSTFFAGEQPACTPRSRCSSSAKRPSYADGARDKPGEISPLFSKGFRDRLREAVVISSMARL